MKRIGYIIGLAALMAAGCHGDPPMVGQPTNTNGKGIEENMINANRTIAQAEETAIAEYVARHKWPMQQLTNGARVWEYSVGKGRQVSYEDSVHLQYDIEAINGTKIYNGVSDNYIAGRRRDMIGLDEAVMQLHFGSRAKIILPSSLGYGIGGDGDRIPQSAILVFDVLIEDQ